MATPENQAKTFPLLRLAPELRLMIYKELFASTELVFGQWRLPYAFIQVTNPAINPLAILRTCHLISTEASPLWLGQVLFAFEFVEDMLDELSELSPRIISQIRRVRVGGRPLGLRSWSGRIELFGIPWAIKLLPGLCLDTLTVRGVPIPEISCETVEDFVKYGCGWRELRYINPNSKLLAFSGNTILPCWRKPQPSTWNRLLIQRDGAASGSSVAIYRSMQSNSPGSVLKPEARTPFEQELLSNRRLEDFGMSEDLMILRGAEIGKEILVVARRGRKVDIVEHDQPPYRSGDIRVLTGNLRWA